MPLKQFPAVTAPTVKLLPFWNSITPAVVDAAENVVATAFVAALRSTLAVARAPRAPAVIVPLAFCVMLPPSACKRTVFAPAFSAALMFKLPVVRQSSTSPSAVRPVTLGVKQPSAVTVPSAKPSLSANENAPVVVAASVSTSLVAELRLMPPVPARTPKAADVMAAPPDSVMLLVAPAACNRTTPVVVPATPVEMLCVSVKFPVVTHSVTLSSVVVMPFVAPTVPIMSESASTYSITPLTFAASVPTVLASVSEYVPVPSSSNLSAEMIELAASVTPPADVLSVTVAPTAVMF